MKQGRNIGIMSILCMIATAQIEIAQCQAAKPINRPYSVQSEFKNVTNFAAFNKVSALTSEQKSLLKSNLFVCYPRGDHQLYWVYGRNDYRNLPSFVTSDAVLQLYHVFFDTALRTIEQDKLYPLALNLSRQMLAESVRQFQSASDPLVKSAATKNIAYFAVALNQLGETPKIDTDAQELVRRELDLIKAANGFDKGAIFPYKLDYSQFIVRGHYTKTQTLQRYFRTMMWFGLAPFAVKYSSPTGPVRADEQIIQAVLITRGLYRSHAIKSWNLLYEPTTLFAGKSSGLTPADWKAKIEVVYGLQPPVDSFSDSSKMDQLIVELTKLRNPTLLSKKRGNDVADDTMAFRFMGQRNIPDSIILQRLTGDDRWFPSGLDVAAVLGSVRAKSILDANAALYNPKNWKGYLPERKKLSTEFAAFPASAWSTDLYWSWLDTLRTLLVPFGVGYPSFMQNTAWQDRSLNTMLASWTELRHDTLLYGKQSVAESGDGEDPPFVPGYVEPNVALYDRLLKLTKQTHFELSSRKLLSAAIVAKFAGFEDLLAFLRNISLRELQNGKLTKVEHERIRHIEGELENATENLLKAGTGFKALTVDDLDMGLVADVHTGNNEALEEAVGHSYEIVAIVPIEGKLYLARGATMSHYEFRVPVSNRLTDEAWKKKLAKKMAPPPAKWTKSFMAKAGKNQQNE